MDFTRTVTHLEFAAGYGGIGLGLEPIIPAIRTITYVEIEAFAVANLVKKMEAGLLPVAPVWTDVKTFPCEQFCGIVDILSAGYPCQPFSQAGSRKGTADERHLWPHIETAIGVIQPGIVFFENVEGHLSLGLDTVLSDLGELGYDVEAGIFSAEEVGAPHQRKRVFILGIRNGWELSNDFINRNISGCDGEVREGKIMDYTNIEGSFRHNGDEPGTKERRKEPYRSTTTTGILFPSKPRQVQPEWEPPRIVGDPNESRLQRKKGKGCSKKKGESTRYTPKSDEWETKSPLGGDDDGNPDWVDVAELYQSGDNRTDELRMCVNGVVPATVTKAFITLYNKLIKS